MATLDLRKHATGACFGCGQTVGGTALAVWAVTEPGEIAALLCDVCHADRSVCEALSSHLLARPDLARMQIEWETDDPAAPLAFAPATKANILARLAARQTFMFIP